MRSKKRASKAMRADGIRPEGESKYAIKKRERARMARKLGYAPDTPFPVMGARRGQGNVSPTEFDHIVAEIVNNV